MSLQNRKKQEGESGVRDWFNKWFPYHKQGVGATIMTSAGKNDIGDIDGVPFTMVEVKNYAKPPLGSLTVNAEWKADNAQRDFWILVIKRKGFSAKRAGHWYCVSTVSGMEHFGLQDDQGRGIRELLSIPGEHTMSTGGVHYANIWAGNPPAQSLTLNVSTCYNRVLDSVRKDGDGIVLNTHPRRKMDEDRFFVVTTLDEYCRMLESVGILPPVDSQEGEN